MRPVAPTHLKHYKCREGYEEILLLSCKVRALYESSVPHVLVCRHGDIPEQRVEAVVLGPTAVVMHEADRDIL